MLFEKNFGRRHIGTPHPNNEMQISLITAMQNDTDRHNPNGEYLTFNIERGNICYGVTRGGTLPAGCYEIS